MIIVPFRTDAPVYYFPWTTCALMVVSVAAFIATGGGDHMGGWELELGRGLHPLQWVTSNFLHAGILHLLFNLIFLWGFGLVVEGKVGWWRYLAIVLGIGVVQAAILQAVLLGYAGPPLAVVGSSSIIFGLVAIAIVWAPRNEVEAYWWLVIRVVYLEIPIQSFGFLFFGIEILFLVLFSVSFGITLTASLFHLLSAGLGVVIAVAMLKWGWVDCENWDIFAVTKGTHGTRPGTFRYEESYYAGEGPRVRDLSDIPPSPDDAVPEPSPDELASQADRMEQRRRKKIRKFLEAGDAPAALSAYRELQHRLPGAMLSEPELREMARGLYEHRSYRDAAEFLEQYIERFPKSADRMRLKLAMISIEYGNRPRYALRVLEDVDEYGLDKRSQKLLGKVRRKAQSLVDAGTIELEGQKW